MVSSTGKSGGLGLQRNLNEALKSQQKSIEKLSSGKRVNRASDDAAAAAISAALEADTRVARTGVRNAADGISLANIAEGSLNSLSDINARRQELAAQSANGTLSDEQRSTLNAEYQALGEEASRIISSTEFNGQNVFQGDITLQVGTDASPHSQITLKSANVSGLVTGGDISTQGSAQTAMDSLKSESNSLSSIRGELGAQVSRVNQAQSNLETRIVENQAANSRLMDADIAQESANFVANNIRAQSATALQAQANLSSRVVLSLLS